MVEAVNWAEACTRAYWPKGTFIEAYRKSQPPPSNWCWKPAQSAALLIRFMEGRDNGEAQPADCLRRSRPLSGNAPPRSENGRSGQTYCRTNCGGAPALRKTGIHVTFHEETATPDAVINITAGRAHQRGKAETSFSSFSIVSKKQKTK